MNFDTFDNYEKVPVELCKELKAGDLIKFSGSESFNLYVIGQIIYPKNGNPKDNGFVEYWPESTPVRCPSMIKLHAVKRVKQLKDFKLITLC